MSLLILFLLSFSTVSSADVPSWGNAFSSDYYSPPSHFRGSGSAPSTSIDLDPQNLMNSSFRIATREGRVSEMRRLLEQGAEVDSRTNSGETALMLASRKCSTNLVKFLISAHANINAADFEGKTALIVASRESCAEAVDLLVRVPGVDIDAKDQSHRSALEYANENSVLEVGGPSEKIMASIYNAKYSGKKRTRLMKRARA